MSKKHFIALADVMRETKPHQGAEGDMYLHARMAQWEQMRDALADWCRHENYAFKRERWIDYINGECGPNGEEIRKRRAA